MTSEDRECVWGSEVCACGGGGGRQGRELKLHSSLIALHHTYITNSLIPVPPPPPKTHPSSQQVKVADAESSLQGCSADVARWMVSAGRHQHQSILPWLWDVLSDDDLIRAPGVCVCV